MARRNGRKRRRQQGMRPNRGAARGDRRPPPLLRVDLRFPRLHGDRPREYGDPRRGPTCPACTGVNPGPAHGLSRSRGLPRAHGDPPGPTPAEQRAAAVAPPARGSTRCYRSAAGPESGLPRAHGIHRRRPSEATRRARLARAHGDPPRTDVRSPGPDEVAPRARGSTAELITNLPRQGITPRARGSTRGPSRVPSGGHKLPRMFGYGPP